uniref:Uncharacterized protein n=1 Tax=Knipowitschia caucasica TaxID=637954 RepID=A0AAV2KGF1_KNICA
MHHRPHIMRDCTTDTHISEGSAPPPHIMRDCTTSSHLTDPHQPPHISEGLQPPPLINEGLQATSSHHEWTAPPPHIIERLHYPPHIVREQPPPSHIMRDCTTSSHSSEGLHQPPHTVRDRTTILPTSVRDCTTTSSHQTATTSSQTLRDIATTPQSVRDCTTFLNIRERLHYLLTSRELLHSPHIHWERVVVFAHYTLPTTARCGQRKPPVKQSAEQPICSSHSNKTGEGDRALPASTIHSSNRV